MNNLLDRIKYISENEGIKITNLEKSIGASKGVLSRALSNNTDIQSKWLIKIVENYPLYNTDWLLTGSGDVFKSTITSKDLANEDIATYSPEKKIPLIPVEAMAGWGNGDVSVMDYDTHRYVVPEFTELNVDFMIRVKGSSMYPKYNSGDIVACKKLPSDTFFQWNKVYVLDTIQGAMIKRVHRSELDNHISCVSDNPKYTPFDLPTDEIHSLAIVLGVIRLE